MAKLGLLKIVEPSEEDLKRVPDGIDVSAAIIHAAVRVHTELGPGLPKQAYVAALETELKNWNLGVRKDVPVNIKYRGQEIEGGLVIDLMAGEEAVFVLTQPETGQEKDLLRNYMRHSGANKAHLINFHAPDLRKAMFRAERKVPVAPKTMN